MKHTFMAGGVDPIAMTVRESVKLDDGIRRQCVRSPCKGRWQNVSGVQKFRNAAFLPVIGPPRPTPDDKTARVPPELGGVGTKG